LAVGHCRQSNSIANSQQPVTNSQLPPGRSA
jgi:hypothetical protein